MESIIIITLAVLFIWLLVKSKQSNRKLNSSRRNIVDKIKSRDRF